MTARRNNRLAASTSPYLLQHAHNPVDWWPWGPEAFEEARRRDVPIFLSIGYSTCYWCHVMERESFENDALGRLLSDSFVCIKVDREERPDVDDLYMQATLAVRGQGGWPMSVFLEPASLRPFWCATYIPPSTRGQMAGLPQIVEGISSAWRNQRDAVIEQARQIAQAVREQLAEKPAPVPLSPAHVGAAVEQLLRMFDRQHGGFGAAPKFPQPVFLEFLLAARASVDAQSRGAVELALRHTLDKMATGGLFDQLAGGFHRYSVDAHWTVPHFEKMLYDNAMLAGVYAHAALDFADPFYAAVTQRTIDYMKRELGLPAGGFASAQDAEVDGREGLNYVWTAAQIREVLPPADAEFALETFGVARGPNFQDPHHPHDPPSSVLRLADRPDRPAEQSGHAAGFARRLADVSAALLTARHTRVQPRLDDKLITGWNGLAIAALAHASIALDRRDWRDDAQRAAEMILDRMITADGRLLRCFRDGKAHTPAVLEDYAFLARGLLALDAALGGSSRWLADARRLAATARGLFRDGAGAWFDTPADQPDLFVRGRSTHDGALPSGGSVMLHVLLDLYLRTGEPAWLDDALALLSSLSGLLAAGPVGCTTAALGLLRVLTDPRLSAAAQAAGVTTDAPDAAPPPQPPSSPTPVEFYAGVDSVRIGEDLPAEFTLLVRIPPALHIPAADPGPAGAGLTPFRVDVVGGKGIAVYAEYPPGEPYAAPGQSQSILVYRGEFELRVAVEKQGEWSGAPAIAAHYQACTDTECLRPTTVQIDVLIERG